jgi:hypothetical protein
MICPTVEQHGFTIISGVIDTDKQQELLAAIGNIVGAGRRGILALPAIAALARSIEKYCKLLRIGSNCNIFR